MSNVKLVYDEKGCWGCGACEVACKQEYNPFAYNAYSPDNPDSIKYVKIWGDGPKYVKEDLRFVFRANVCKHCDDAPCIKSCPENAISVDVETDIVVHDKEKCNGCDAVQGTSGVEKQETSPCKFNCPAKNDVQGYVNLAAKGKYREALELIKETSPFPSICGRVCHHPCESDCNRNQIDDPLSIRAIERFVADRDLSSWDRYVPVMKPSKKEKVAIVGSGPAGLACAYYLAKEGYQVTIYEKSEIPGGMLTMAIPAYRLPRQVVEAEVRLIESMGVTVRAGVEIGKDKTFEELRHEGFKAIFIAVGTQKCLRLGIEGEDLAGIHGGLDYLREVNLGKPIELGKNVAVIGGGNTAIDSVRSARRLGAENAFILYRRGLEEMPARSEEIGECQEEGIPIRTLTQPVRFIGEDGRVTAVECVTMRLGEPDESGRRRPVPVDGSEFTLAVDAVIAALGQEADWACLTPGCACSITGWGTMAVDPITLQTDEPDIFAGGDAVRGPQTVIEAIADGREAAVSINRYLSGEDLCYGRDRRLFPVKTVQKDKYDPSPRGRMPVLDGKARISSFDEVQTGFTGEMAVKEAKRCISCGTCCIQACPYDAIAFNVETGKAQKCNLCIDRVKHGLLPACADNVCLAHCIYFGDARHIDEMVKERFWLKYRIEGTLGSLVIKVGD
jgi:NADPH-dependent glutamate synthase beta subunit-like oxidoreductase